MDNKFRAEPSNIFDLMQNDALSAIVLHTFTLGYYKVAKNKDEESAFPKLEYMFYVLPIVYNHSSMLAFLNSTELYNAINKEHSITLGLQERANKMVYQTFSALNLAFSKKILDLNNSDYTIRLLRPFSSRKIDILTKTHTAYTSVKEIQNCSYKLGGIFAKRHDKNIQQDLNIRF